MIRLMFVVMGIVVMLGISVSILSIVAELLKGRSHPIFLTLLKSEQEADDRQQATNAAAAAQSPVADVVPTAYIPA